MNEAGIPIEKVSSIEWMIVPLFLILISYAVIRHMQVGIISTSFKQYFSFNLANLDYKGNSGMAGRLSIGLMINSIICISILIYKILYNIFIPINPYIAFLMVLGGILALFALKFVIVSIVQNVTESGDVLANAKNYSVKYYEIIGVLLLPGIIAVLLFPESTTVDIHYFGLKSQNLGMIYCVLLLAILYVFKLFQSIRQSLGIKISWYYIILYLCTLEILPLVVIYRLLTGKTWVFN